MTQTPLSSYTGVCSPTTNGFSIARFLRVNERIRVPTLRLIDHNGEQVGIVSREQALQMAKDAELDLVEISPTARPPVCKIIDFGKYQYHQKKLERKQRKQQKQAEVKGIRLGLRTDVGDIEIKAKRAEEFLKGRHTVKVTMILRGREFAHMDMARQKMKTFAERLSPMATVDQDVKKTGNTFNMILTPK